MLDKAFLPNSRYK